MRIGRLSRQNLKAIRGQKGLAMVEFAICAPILMLLLLSVGEVGRMISQYNQLLQATRDSARYVAGLAWDRTLEKVWLAPLEARAKDIAVFGGGSDPIISGLTVSDVEITAEDSEHIRVTIRHEFSPVVGDTLPNLFGEGVPLRVEMVATTVMRVL